jgi:hypothetical protein
MPPAGRQPLPQVEAATRLPQRRIEERTVVAPYLHDRLTKSTDDDLRPHLLHASLKPNTYNLH